MNTDTSLTPLAGRIYGGAAVLGPLLLLASTLAYITAGDGINNGVLGGTIGVWSCFTLAVGLVGILRVLEPVAPKAAPALAALAIIAFSGGVAFNVSAIYLAAFDRDFVEDMSAGDEIGIFAFLPWGLFAPLTFVLVGVVLWRTRAVARWSAALFVAGGILFVMGRPERINAIAITTDVVLILAIAPIGWAIFTGSRLIGGRALADHEAVR